MSKKKKATPGLTLAIAGVTIVGMLFSGANKEEAYQTTEETIIEDTTPLPTGEELSEMEVHFLNVGQGLSILVKANDEILIYDGGNREHSSFVVSYLKEQGIQTIDYLISSHYDEDHISGLIGCLNTFTIENVIGSDYVHDSHLYDSFMEKVSSKDLAVQHPEVGTEFEIGSASFTILAPSSITNSDNNNSVAIKLENGDNSFIFTGDAESESENFMIESGIDLSCDVLCIGHHGSADSTSQNFLDKTAPRYAVLSCGISNIFGHPDAETMERLSSMSIALFRTDKQDTIIAKSDGKTITWNTQPCNDYSSGAQAEEPETVTANIETDTNSVSKITYILNTNSQKFHYDTCSSVRDISAKNREDTTQSREELINSGYVPCKRCNP